MLKEIVIRNLRNDIVKGKYRPGEHLGEVSLCRRFNLSRTPIREALRELVKDGLVVIIPNAGARVVKLSKEDVSHIYDMLITIEGAACRLGCPLIKAEQISKLEEYQFLIEGAAGQKNYDLVFNINQQFHRLIVESTRNPYLIQIWQNLFHMVIPFGRFTLSPMVPGQLKATVEEHPEIIEAIKKRNPPAAEFFAKKHMESARKFMFEYLEKYQSDSEDEAEALIKEKYPIRNSDVK
jgi:DNA-binding GntR family transcriptional regulator